MSDNEGISEKELRILLAHDKHEPIENTATTLGMTVPEARKILATALKKREKLISEAGAGGAPFVYYRPIDETVGIPQKGTMKVGSQILKQLSEGIYTSPAGSLKELISNSYDSDASEVVINITEDEVSVRDNGNGMDWRDFDKEFTFISYSTKRSEKDKTEVYGRPIIGFIGIGFIAVSELCDLLEIRSCKKKSELLFKATIDFSKYRKPEAAKKEFYEISEYELINRRKEDEQIAVDQSFTEIKLKNLRQGFKDIILDRAPFDHKRGISIDRIWQWFSEQGLGITNLGKFWQMILSLALTCPVKYQVNGPVKGISDSIVDEIKSRLESYNFKVNINGVELLKPITFPNNSTILESKEYAVHPIQEKMPTSEGILSFRGYLYSQRGMINPKEFMGVMIRIRNVAIGGFDRTFLDYPSGTNQLLRNWICGEIYVDEGLENAMNINRSSFKITNADYVALRTWLHRFLDENVFRYAHEEYYVKGRKDKEAEDEAEYMRVFDKIVKSELGIEYTFKTTQLVGRQPVLVDRKKKTVLVNTQYRIFRQTPAKNKNLLQRIFVLFEIAKEKSHGDILNLEKIFKEEIEKWISE